MVIVAKSAKWNHSIPLSNIPLSYSCFSIFCVISQFVCCSRYICPNFGTYETAYIYLFASNTVKSGYPLAEPLNASLSIFVMLLVATVFLRWFPQFSHITALWCFWFVQTVSKICSCYTFCDFSIGVHLVFSENVYQDGTFLSSWQFSEYSSSTTRFACTISLICCSRSFQNLSSLFRAKHPVPFGLSLQYEILHRPIGYFWSFVSEITASPAGQVTLFNRRHSISNKSEAVVIFINTSPKSHIKVGRYWAILERNFLSETNVVNLCASFSDLY